MPDDLVGIPDSLFLHDQLHHESFIQEIFNILDRVRWWEDEDGWIYVSLQEVDEYGTDLIGLFCDEEGPREGAVMNRIAECLKRYDRNCVYHA